MPGYNKDGIYAVLDEYGRGGLADDWDSTDSERANQGYRENPILNRSGMINCLEFNGNVQGRMLLEQGMNAALIPDPLRDYMVQAWLIGSHISRSAVLPEPPQAAPLLHNRLRRSPGTPLGNGLADIIATSKKARTALRAPINNLSIASGPQVMINDERLASSEDAEDLYPWKRWHYVGDPMGNNQQVPIIFLPARLERQGALACTGEVQRSRRRRQCDTALPFWPVRWWRWPDVFGTGHAYG